jgi:hypothetical protein
MGQATMAMIEAGREMLILKRASASRPSGHWSDDDFDVLCNGVVVGRIFNSNAAPVGSPCMWTLIFPHHQGRSPTHGYAESRGAAMAAFAKSCCKTLAKKSASATAVPKNAGGWQPRPGPKPARAIISTWSNAGAFWPAAMNLRNGCRISSSRSGAATGRNGKAASVSRLVLFDRPPTVDARAKRPFSTPTNCP